jgi:hypothetical protein
MVDLTNYFNPSLRTNFPVKEKRPKKSFAVYCSCGFQMSYDPSMDIFRCNKCRLCCTPQSLVTLMRTRFK